MRTYISLKSSDHIEGKLYFGNAYLVANPVERMDLLKDWIYDLQQEYEKQRAAYYEKSEVRS